MLTAVFTPYRISVISRVLAAVVGGYGVAVASSFAAIPAGMWLFDISRHEAVLLGMMVGNIVYLAAIVRCFCPARAWHAWRDMLMLTGFMALGYLLGGNWEPVT